MVWLRNLERWAGLADMIHLVVATAFRIQPKGIQGHPAAPHLMLSRKGFGGSRIWGGGSLVPTFLSDVVGVFEVDIGGFFPSHQETEQRG